MRNRNTDNSKCGERGWEWRTPIGQLALTEYSLAWWEPMMGLVKTSLNPFLSRGGGHDPPKEILFFLRDADHDILQELCTPLQGSRSKFPKRGPNPPQGCRPQYPERSLILLRTAGHNTLKEVLIQVRELRHHGYHSNGSIVWVYAAKSELHGRTSSQPTVYYLSISTQGINLTQERFTADLLQSPVMYILIAGIPRM